MSENKSQKSIEDYRNIIKLLKLKVMKLQKRNQELEQKMNPFDDSFVQQEIGDILPNKKNIQTNPQYQSDGALFQQLYRGCRQIGITPEGLYRAFDKDQSQNLSIEEFKLSLRNTRLELTQEQCNRLASLADKNATGQVSWDYWLELLEIYEVNQEKTRHGGSRSYAQQSVIELAKFLSSQNLTPEDSFEKISSGHSSITQDRLKQFCINARCKLSEQQINSAFNKLDFGGNGRVSQNTFVNEIKKYMKISQQEQGMSTSRYQQSPERLQLRGKISSVHSDSKMGNSKFMKKSLSRGKTLKNSLAPGDGFFDEFKVRQADQSQVVKQLRKQNVDIALLFKTILQELKNPLGGITVKDVFDGFTKTAPQVDKKLQYQFFTCLDSGGNGGADFEESLEFYCNHVMIKGDDDFDLELILGLKKQHLKAIQQTPKEFLREHHIEENTILNEKTFQYQAKKLFTQGIEEGSENKKQIMNLLAKRVIKNQNNKESLEYQLKKAKISKKQHKKKKQKEEIPLDIDELGKWLVEARKQQNKTYKLQDEDFFYSVKLEGDVQGEAIKTKWSTILNDEISCLIRCLELINEMKKKKDEYFFDPEFGPNSTDRVAAKSLYFGDNDIPTGSPKPEDIQWLRPDEIREQLIEAGYTFKTGFKNQNGEDIEMEYEDKQPMFMDNGATSDDVVQSEFLGNCWFVSALSIISKDDNLLNGYFDATEESLAQIDNKEADGMRRGVYPPMFHFLEQYGMYVCRFLKDGAWRYVIVDDRLPTKGFGQIVFGQCKQRIELWVPIIEKAYAKLHNCYQSLISGDIAQGLADLSGLISDRIKMNFEYGKQLEGQEKIKVQKQADELWERIKMSKSTGSMMGCSASGDTEGMIEREGHQTGILSGHAYSVLDVLELPYLPEYKDKKKGRGFHRLLRIRNPWGHGEWMNKWSDISPDYKEFTFKHEQNIKKHYQNARAQIEKWNKQNPNDKKDINEVEDMILGENDGTFLMSFKDWREIFTNLFICIDFPNHYTGRRILGAWTEELSGGVPSGKNAANFGDINPQYVFTVNRRTQNGPEKKNTTSFYIQLSQKDGRLYLGEKYPFDRVTDFLLLLVCRLEDGETQLKRFSMDQIKKGTSSGDMALRREVATGLVELENGTYAIIPCTKKAGHLGEFSISIYFDCANQDIQFKQIPGRPQYEPTTIREEEENVEEFSKEFKLIYQSLGQKELEYNQKKKNYFEKQKQKIKALKQNK